MQVKWYHIVTLLSAFALGWYLAGKDPKIVEIKGDPYPVPYKVDSIIYQTDTLKLPSDPIDTLAVVEDYYRERSFDTTIVVNEVKLNIGGSVFENRLQGLDFNVANTRPTQVVQDLKWSFSGGVTAGREVFSPTLYSRYANHELGVGYNLIGQSGFMLTYKYTFLEL